MADVLARVDRITVEARRVRPGRVILTVFAAVLFSIGWVAGALWLAVAWSATAVKVGWMEAARKPAGGDRGSS